MNRGRRGEAVFKDKKDYRRFIELLREATETWNLRVSAYCLMANHYHLLFQTPEGNLSRCMRHIDGVYTQHFTKCSSVSSVIQRMEALISTYRRLKERIEELAELSKSQEHT